MVISGINNYFDDLKWNFMLVTDNSCNFIQIATNVFLLYWLKLHHETFHSFAFPSSQNRASKIKTARRQPHGIKRLCLGPYKKRHTRWTVCVCETENMDILILFFFFSFSHCTVFHKSTALKIQNKKFEFDIFGGLSWHPV